MTKTFEEKAQQEVEQANNTYEVYQGCFKSEVPDGGLVVRIGDQILRFPWLEFAKNWHSDEEYQELLEKYVTLNKHFEKEVIKNSKIESEITGLKREIKQQALPVVPEFIGKLINTFGAPEDGKYINYSASYPVHQKELDWIDNHQKTWLTALLFGFTVEKPQLFYLKNKITKTFLYDNGLEFGECDKNCKDWEIFKTKFTQQEIDSMQTGSYEQIEVAE